MAEGALSNVTEHLAGSELDFDASAGFSTIYVVDIDEFDADGGVLAITSSTTPVESALGMEDSGQILLEDGSGLVLEASGAIPGPAVVETYSYTVPEDSVSQIDLDTPLLTSHIAGEQVLQSPSLIERIAWIQDTEQEEELKARIPHALFDAIPLGSRNGNPEVVEYDFRGEEIVVLDILGREPLRDGSFIDPTTLPPPGTDGNPPTTSPTPTVRGGIGALVVQWGGIGNNDPVNYEVHLSASSGFIPSPATFATETPGTLLFLRTLPGGIALAYDTTYYVRLVAKDADGKAGPSPEASGQMSKVTSPDLAVDSILANHILAGEITAEKLAAVLIISNAIKTAEDGQRVEIDPTGIRLVSQAEDTLVELPTDPGAAASFAGSVIANALTVLDRLSIQGPNNVVDSGGVVTVSSSLSTPGTAPVVTLANDSFALQGIEDGGDYVTNRGLYYDPVGINGTPALLSAAIVNGSIIVYEHDATTGDMQGTGVIQAPFFGVVSWNRVCGVTRRGTVIYVLGWRGAAELVVTRLRASTLVKLSEHVITAPHQAEPYRSTISTIGSSVFVWGFTGTSVSEQIERHEFTDNDTNAGAWTYVGVVNYAGLTFDGRAGGHTLEGHVRVSGQDWIAHDRDGVHGANSFDTTTRAFEDETGWVGQPRGIAHDGTDFLSRASARVIQHTGWDWASNLKYLIYAYSWRDDTANNYESLTSPQKALNVRPDGPAHRAYRRNRVKITIPPLPTGVPKFRLYIGHSVAQTLGVGSLHHQPATAYISTQSTSPTYQVDENLSSIPPLPSGTNGSVPWPGSTSKIKSQTASWELSGSDATGLLRLLPGVKQTMNSGNDSITVTAGNSNTKNITHGFASAPARVICDVAVAPGGAVPSAEFYAQVTAIAATTFTARVVRRDTGNVTATVPIAWLAIG